MLKTDEQALLRKIAALQKALAESQGQAAKKVASRESQQTSSLKAPGRAPAKKKSVASRGGGGGLSDDDDSDGGSDRSHDCSSSDGAELDEEEDVDEDQVVTSRKPPVAKKKTARKPTAASAKKPSSKAQVAAKKKADEPESDKEEDDEEDQVVTTRKPPAEKKKTARKPTVASVGKPSGKAQVAAKKKADEPEAEPTVRIDDFRWKTSNMCVGYFMAEFDGDGEVVPIGVKELLYDFPKEGLEFIFQKYGRFKRVVDYIEKQAKMKYGGGSHEVAKRQVVPGFQDLPTYRRQAGLTAPANWQATGLRKLLHNKPPVDTKYVLKNKGKKHLKVPPSVSSEMHQTKEAPPAGSSEVSDSVSPIGIDGGGVSPVVQGKGDGDVAVEKDVLEAGDREAALDTDREVGDGTPSSVVWEGGDEILTPIVKDWSVIGTPTVKRGAGRVAEEDAPPERQCEPPKRHDWDEYSSDTWVKNDGRLSGKCCIGIRDGRVCGRVFSETALEGGIHVTDVAYHPTIKNMAYGCNFCERAMCGPCKNHYEAMLSPSITRRGR